MLCGYRIRVPNAAWGRSEVGDLSCHGHLWKAVMDSIPLLLDTRELELTR